MSDRVKLIPSSEIHINNSRRPGRKLKVLILFAIFVIVLFTLQFSSQRTSSNNFEGEIFSDYFENKSYDEYDEEESTPVPYDYDQSSIKYVLFWTKFFNNPSWYTGELESGEEVLKSVQCPVTNCIFTHNKLKLNNITDFDAIAFHGPEYRQVPLPNSRSPHQLYIFSSLESPTAIMDDLRQYKNFYNMTMTYRMDSDVQWDYGKIFSKKTNQIIAPSMSPKWRKPNHNFYDKDLFKLISKKTKSIAWFVSNCNTRSNRNELERKIQKLIDVDVYGKCGKLKCPVDAKECMDLLDKDYKFYLSFENSLCKDYITEKLFRPLNQYVIPIVFNGGNTSLYAPPKSYINANDFKTPEDLVKYLKHLIDNPREYLKYFWWKEHYYIKSHPVYEYMLCDLCKKLNNPTFMEATHRQDDIYNWYRKTDCNQQNHKIKF